MGDRGGLGGGAVLAWFGAWVVCYSGGVGLDGIGLGGLGYFFFGWCCGVFVVCGLIVFLGLGWELVWVGAVFGLCGSFIS